jgi:tRNA(Ile)-lysidine synthase
LHILSVYFDSKAKPIPHGACAERLVAVHVNHMLRGEESLRDEEYTSEICANLGVRLVRVMEDVPAYASSQKISFETAGREVRYRALENERASLCAISGREWRIAVAHNSDDQAETVLMNALRGAGIKGLRGMAVKGEDISAHKEPPGRSLRIANIIRPLINVTREQINEYLCRNALVAVDDSSNADTSYMRNRVRVELLPLIRERYYPGASDALIRLSEAAALDDDYLSLEAEKAYIMCQISDAQLAPDNENLYSSISLSITRLNTIHSALATRVVGLACGAVLDDMRNIGRVHIKDALALAACGRTGAELHLPGGLIIRRTYDSLVFNRDRSRESCGSRGLHGFVTKSLHKKDNEIVELVKKLRYNSTEQLFDADTLRSDEIVLRRRQSGDFFYPIKSPGAKKLKKYFIDAKIPGELRDDICLLAVGSEIVWVIGYRISERFKVTDETVNILRIRYYADNRSVCGASDNVYV